MNILNFLEQKAKYMNVINAILGENTKQNIYVGNAACNLSRMLAALTYLKSNQNIVYIAENIYEASKAYETFCDLSMFGQYTSSPIFKCGSIVSILSLQT